MISIMMQGTNQKCNALQSVFGIFLHTCNTPQKVIDALAHMGVSISVDAIHNAVRSLSAETYIAIRELGQTLLVAYAYDNFDINFKTHQPTVEGQHDTLTHLTSGTLIQLEHGVTLDDLRCSDELWEKSHFNPVAINLAPSKTVVDLEGLHPEADHPSGLSRRQRYIAHKFRSDLCEHGPEYFRRFSKDLGLPEWVEKVSVVPMTHVPARAMDINQSKVAGNISAIANLLAQGGVGDPEQGKEPKESREQVEEPEVICVDQHDGGEGDEGRDKEPERQRELEAFLEEKLGPLSVKDMRKYVILFHGDLGTAERVLGIRQQRAIEETAYRRYQFIVFIIGLFHLKMACADAIWRIFIQPLDSRVDVNSLMEMVGKYRDRETGKIGSDPGFRRMHEVIQHTGTALRLDAWKTEARRRQPSWTTLEEFAAAKPSLKDIEDMSGYLAMHYVAGYEANIFDLRGKPSTQRDAQHENILIMHQYFLLYEEITFAMNFGDVGRLETLFPAWIYIFTATGKHKYATHMTAFLTDVHFVYPPGLKYVHYATCEFFT